MGKQSTYHIVVNGLGALAGLALLGYIAYSFFRIEERLPCTAHYPAPTRFALTAAGGAPLSPIELQARVGLREWGVMENAQIVAADTPGGAALEVKLAPVSGEHVTTDRDANGVDFRWAPLGMKGAGAACLSYKVWLPDGFAFGEGGVLPGIFGGPSLGQSGTADRFAARLEWSGDGQGTVAAAAALAGFRPINLAGFPLAAGRWVRVEEELVLNRPGEANGILRLWTDGKLQVEDKGLELRKDDDAKILGVLADVGYLRQPPAAASLKLSPFEISWR